MSTLLEFQRCFRDAIFGNEDASARILHQARGAAAANGFAIYRNNIIANLTRVLRLSFPALDRLVGAEYFDRAAACYVLSSPPKEPDLYQYGSGFAHFLETFAAAHAAPYLPDVARLEWAVNLALHAPAKHFLDLQKLASIAPERQSVVRFKAQAGLSLLHLAYPARAIWEAVLVDDEAERNAALSSIDLSNGEERLCVICDSDGLQIRPMTQIAFTLGAQLHNGASLGAALSAIDPDSAIGALAECFSHKLFSDFVLSDSNDSISGG